MNSFVRQQSAVEDYIMVLTNTREQFSVLRHFFDPLIAHFVLKAAVIPIYLNVKITLIVSRCRPTYTAKYRSKNVILAFGDLLLHSSFLPIPEKMSSVCSRQRILHRLAIGIYQEEAI